MPIKIEQGTVAIAVAVTAGAVAIALWWLNTRLSQSPGEESRPSTSAGTEKASGKPEVGGTGAPSPITKTQWAMLRVASNDALTHNTRLLSIKVFPPGACIDVPPGKHVQLGVRNADDGKVVSHSYTPVHVAPGHFDVCYKVYPEGRLTPKLAELKRGSVVMVKGPTGTFDFDPARWDSLWMVAGGTGLTPILAVARAVARARAAPAGAAPRCHIAYFNSTPGDVMCREHLDALVAAAGGAVAVTYFVSRLGADGSAWDGRVGRVDAGVLAEAFGCSSFADDPRSHGFVCGPSGFVAAAKAAFTNIGLEGRERVTVF